MPRLDEVFGIRRTIPTHTYVNRASLDEKFQYLLQAERHVVIYGSSKQGKTVLRKKNLPEEKSIVVQCRIDATLESVYFEILRKLNTKIPTELSKSLTVNFEGKGEGSGKLGLPLVGEASAKLEGSVGLERTTGEASIPIGIDASSIGFISEEIKKSKKRVVLEDFHYLPEDEQRRLAFDLKSFWDEGVFFVIIGIWAEQNLLTYYNRDLSGRIEEIDIKWTDSDLLQVITKGENSLNIKISPEKTVEVLADATSNVGLLQRILEKYCIELGVFETQPQRRNINDDSALNKARTLICQEESARYKNFAEAVMRGYKGYSNSELQAYKHILKAFLEFTDAEIASGVHRDTIFQKLSTTSAPVERMSDLSAALNRINRLQVKRKISPLIISYNSNNKIIHLVDKELIFYRKYGTPVWPWQEETATS